MECVNEVLIPGLPDDLALLCLAKISHGFLGVLECVCKRWRDVIRIKDYAVIKSRMGWCGDWLFVYMIDDSHQHCWKAYDPEADRWHHLPPMPKVNNTHHIWFSSVCVCNRLLVIGGLYFCSNLSRLQIPYSKQVFSFDPYRQEWSEVASMSTPRACFACCVIGNKVYVGGGSSKSVPGSEPYLILSAEVYDPVKDRWEELPSMPKPIVHCYGISNNNKFCIVNDVFNYHDAEIMDSFSLIDGQWTTPDKWQIPKQLKYHIVSINDCLYTIKEEALSYSLQALNSDTGDWNHIDSVPSVILNEGGGSTRGTLICGLRNKLYIIGGMAAIDPDKPDHLVKQNTVRFCDTTTTPLQWSKSTIPDYNGCHVRVVACASLEECMH